ncbi:MAG: hypothetical protein FD167_1098, partial [bacterium]
MLIIFLANKPVNKYFERVQNIFRKQNFIYDTTLLSGGYQLSYFSDGPYSIVRKEGKRAPVLPQNLTYGETPCLTIRKILQELELKPSDHFVDLGCGRGLTVFFVNQYFHIPATGVDIIPTFIRRAKILAKNLGLTQVKFI